MQSSKVTAANELIADETELNDPEKIPVIKRPASPGLSIMVSTTNKGNSWSPLTILPSFIGSQPVKMKKQKIVFEAIFYERDIQFFKVKVVKAK